MIPALVCSSLDRSFSWVARDFFFFLELDDIL
jgi:hypothetical protein